MASYAILANPGHNRVYFDASSKLSLAELALACGKMASSPTNPRITVLGNIPYFQFETDIALSDEEIAVLSRLSFAYAIFEVVDGDGDSCLRPMEKRASHFLDSGISSILKYTGKTNELFTRLMINTALFSSNYATNERIRLLDPVAGKGTTLFEGLRDGMDVSGMEIGGRAVQEACTYFKKYLETEKYKHTFEKEGLSGENKSFRGKLYKFRLASTKEEFKNPEFVREFTLAEGDSRYVDRFYRKNSFHILVGDLPYGVAHGNVTTEKQSSLTRNPTELLKACLPAWRNVLMPGGSIVLAWNKFVLPREQMETLLEEHGLSVLRDGPYGEFEHMVDRAIKRDIVVARK